MRGLYWSLLVTNASADLVSGGSRAVTNAIASLTKESGTGVAWEKEINFEGTTKFISLHFKGVEVAGVACDIVFRGAGSQELSRVSCKELSRSTEYISKEFDGSYVLAQLVVASYAQTGMPVVRFEIDRAFTSTSVTTAYSAPKNNSDLENIKGAAALLRASDAVARLDIKRISSRTGEYERASCTGFLVGDDVMMTNWHCIPDPSACTGTSVTFEPQRASPGEKEIEFKCHELVDSNYRKDYAIVRISKFDGGVTNIGAANRRGTLSLSTTAISTKQHLTILGFPEGGAMRMSSKRCFASVLNANGRWSLGTDDVSTTCSTGEGNSGSPVLNDNFQVVALHHLGYDDYGKWEAENRAVKLGVLSPLVSGVLQTIAGN